MAPPNTDHWTTDREYIDLLNYIIERTKNVESPMNIRSLAREFKEMSGSVQLVSCIGYRIETLRTRIQSSEHIDKNTKVKVIFALSASVDADLFEELRKNAFVQVDEKNRIVYYKAIDGSLTLRGDHSMSTKQKTAQLESKRSRRSMIIDYFENKKNADAVPKTNKEKEMWNLIEFITEKCEIVNSPLSIRQLAKDFKEYFGVSRSLDCLYGRIKSYCSEIQKTEYLDTHSKVKQLFCLSGTLDSECLKKFREDAFVEVDHMKRITKFVSNNSRLTLFGAHNSSAKLRQNELDDYDTNYSMDDKVKLEPFRGRVQEDFDEFKKDEDIQQIPKPPQAHDEHNQIEEVPIKVEHEEPVEVKPEISHSSRIKFFEAMQSLILFLNTPSLSRIQTKIRQKIQKLGRPDEVILNNEIVQIVDLLISQIIDHSEMDLCESVESMNLSNFLCYLNASILNSKLSGVEGLVMNISELIEKLQNKRIPIEEVANALRATLDIDGF